MVTVFFSLVPLRICDSKAPLSGTTPTGALPKEGIDGGAGPLGGGGGGGGGIFWKIHKAKLVKNAELIILVKVILVHNSTMKNDTQKITIQGRNVNHIIRII